MSENKYGEQYVRQAWQVGCQTSMAASFGAIKLIFQDGYLQGLLHFVPVGAVDINFPVLIVAMAFGLSMDYGVGLVIAIAVDATIVRGLLVPATMRLLGKRAWWSPAPLAGWWERNGIKEGQDLAPSDKDKLNSLAD